MPSDPVTPPSQLAPWKTACAVTLVLFVLAVSIAAVFPSDHTGTGWLDLRLYTQAIRSMLNGDGLYEYALGDIAGPVTFLYPPFAAVVLTPLALAPTGSAITFSTIAQLALSGVLVWLVAREAGRLDRVQRPIQLAGVVLAWAGFVVTRPVLEGISLGQVSLAVTAAAVIDLLVIPPKWRGILVGVAGAVKLVPMLFVALFWVTGQRRAAWNAIVTFAGCAVVSAVLLPAESWDYWTRILYNSARVPSLDSQRNLSILGNLQFWEVPQGWQPPVWLLASTLVVSVALWRSRRYWDAGDRVGAVLVAGMATSLASPVTWSHFLVWLPLTCLHIGFAGRWRGVRAAGWLLLALLCVASPVWPDDSIPGWRVVLAVTPAVLAVTIALLGLPPTTAGRVADGRQPEPEGIDTSEGGAGTAGEGLRLRLRQAR